MSDEERSARIATYNRQMLEPFEDHRFRLLGLHDGLKSLCLEPVLDHKQYDTACEITYDRDWFRSTCDYAVLEFVLIQQPTIPEPYRSVAVSIPDMTKLTQLRLQVGAIILTDKQNLCNLGVDTRLIPSKIIHIDNDTPGIVGENRFLNIYEGVKGPMIEESILR